MVQAGNEQGTFIHGKFPLLHYLYYNILAQVPYSRSLIIVPARIRKLLYSMQQPYRCHRTYNSMVPRTMIASGSYLSSQAAWGFRSSCRPWGTSSSFRHSAAACWRRSKTSSGEEGAPCAELYSPQRSWLQLLSLTYTVSWCTSLLCYCKVFCLFISWG